MLISTKTKADIDNTLTARKLTLSGHVQGVGFRPFVFRLANEYQLTGWVRNSVGMVDIFVQGSTHDIESFYQDLINKKPAIAKPCLESDIASDIIETDEFKILDSTHQGETHISVPNDLYLCDDCLEELNDPENRRYRYPFINCTQCGPRYTLIRELPYDRHNTTMVDFDLCAECQAEYDDPNNRRFHAEPVACPTCGPTLEFVRLPRELNKPECQNETALKQTVAALKQGQIVAVKGIGGYHLMCDATNDAAVLRLRQNKARPDKPLAVMFPAPLESPFKVAEQFVSLSAQDQTFLQQAARPILLVKKTASSALSKHIAPNLNEVGVMLPYSPLHHLLLNDFASPLVVTSANMSGEPVLTDNAQIENRLSHVVDACLHHNRPIQRPADDPVYRSINNKPRPIRTGRGIAPIELSLPFKLPQAVLAVGAHMKNTVTLAWDNRSVISPHIGEMGNARSVEVFEQTIDDLQQLYGVKAEQIICDAHPSYSTTRWAHKQAIPVHKVYHHHAHAAAAYYECESAHGNNEAVLAFTWDGVGYGEDDSLWGGETLLGMPNNWSRLASLKPFYLPGADKAGREPWRSAAAVYWEMGLSLDQIPVQEHDQMSVLKQAWTKKINSPKTSSMGRLFDAVAALTGVCTTASFEGQGPMQLEALVSSHIKDNKIVIDFELDRSGDLLLIDWQPVIRQMMDTTLNVIERAELFHLSLARCILQQAIIFRKQYGVNMVCLSGGVFQNRVLSEQAMALLSAENFKVCLPELIPVNDAGISFGQIMQYGYKH